MIDYEETYSPVMDTIIFRFLINIDMSQRLDVCLVDVVPVYLYGSLDSDIYMKILKGFKVSKANNTYLKKMFSIKLQRSLYGLFNLDICGIITLANIC